MEVLSMSQPVGCKCFDRSAQLVVHHCKPYHVAGACFGKNDG